MYDKSHHGTGLSLNDHSGDSTMVQEQFNSESNGVASGIVVVVINLLLSGVGVIINIKLYNNVKSEEHQEKGEVIQRIMKMYAIIQAVCWPCVILGHDSLIWIDLELFNLDQSCFIRYFKLSLRYLSAMLACYGGFNSAIIAISRYLFIVREQEVSQFGVKQTKRILIGSSLVVPFITVILWDASFPRQWDATENKLWLLGAKTELSPSSSKLMDEQHFCLFLDGHSNNQTQSIDQSPIYMLSNNYIPTPIIYGMKMLFCVLLSVIFSNIAEGILYSRTFMYLKR